MIQHIELKTTIDENQSGMRLDQALAELFTDYSRVLIKDWILKGAVRVNNQVIMRAREKVFGGEKIEILAEIKQEIRSKPENIALNIVFEDDDILVLDKLAGLIVHPGAGNPNGTLMNALLFHYPKIAELPRAGIVHRLDKDTSGLMVVAKTIPAQTHLVQALQNREITREYEAVVEGFITAGASINEPITRHKTKRTHMAVHPNGKPALTHYRVIKRFREHSYLRLRIETGRTHQIRVHMAHIRHPLVGDPTYNNRQKLPKSATPNLISCLQNFHRQALHAVFLRFHHPISGELLEFHSDLPSDFQNLLVSLNEDLQIFQEKELKRGR